MLPFFRFDMLVFGLRILAAASTMVACIVAFRLYLETDRKWYWLALFLSALSFGVSQWLDILMPMSRQFPVFGPLRDASDIVGGILFAASCYGMYKTMKLIREKVE
jgi:hypothetical protein